MTHTLKEYQENISVPWNLCEVREIELIMNNVFNAAASLRLGLAITSSLTKHFGMAYKNGIFEKSIDTLRNIRLTQGTKTFEFSGSISKTGKVTLTKY